MGTQGIEQEMRNEYQVNISSLYSIEPMGIGTPYVESLTSYIARLAYEHSVLPGTIIRKLIPNVLSIDYLKMKYKKGGTSNYVEKLCGINSISLDLVQALEKLTNRNDIIFMTLNPLKPLFNNRNVIDSYRKWCPCCLDDWRAKEQIIYEPLLWQIELVMYCPIHQCALQNKCPNCERKLKALNNWFQNGICQYCSVWLGASNGERVNWDERSKILIENYCELVAASYTHTNIPTKEKMVFILKVIKDALQYNNKEFAKLFNVYPETVSNWIKGSKFISINSLLDFSYNTNTSIYGIFIKEDFSSLNVLTKLPHTFNKRETILKEKINFNQAYLSLLKDEKLTFNQICKKTSRTPSFFVNNFPNEARKKVDATKQKAKRKRDNAQELLIKVLNEGLHRELSLKALANEYGYSRNYLYKYAPEKCKEISERYKIFKGNQQRKKKEKILIEIREVAIELHKENQYPSTSKIAERMNNSGLFFNDEFKVFRRKILKELGCEAKGN
ncbi:TniQ family protein [Bacillus sp. BH32]|uniref:TniQ family protein n=1 Tax=Bacillus sp. BH32 TaxID=2528961 RepID=UPI0010626CA8|nr:TniQ family protein [Bacillus sp. BH32]NYS75202.1 TniQ family protein [Bacillus sp. BH32]